MAHERFRRFDTLERWPNQTIDSDVALSVRATGKLLFLAGLTGLDLEGRFHGEGDPAAQADRAMKNPKILVEEAGGSLPMSARSRPACSTAPTASRSTTP